MKARLSLAVAALLALPATALAQAYQCTLPESIEPVRPSRPDGPVRDRPADWFQLAASWSPEYCRRDQSSMQCSGRNGRFGFVLHGLWPESRKGAPPQWCRQGEVPSPNLLRRHLCMTPVPGLLAHEWAKHGSCMTRRPETYFKVSAILWRSLRWPDADRLSRRKGLTVGDLREAFVMENPGWRREQVTIETSRTGWLTGIRLCYSRRYLPMRCPAGHARPPDSAPLKIWRGF